MVRVRWLRRMVLTVMMLTALPVLAQPAVASPTRLRGQSLWLMRDEPIGRPGLDVPYQLTSTPAAPQPQEDSTLSRLNGQFAGGIAFNPSVNWQHLGIAPTFSGETTAEGYRLPLDELASDRFRNLAAPTLHQEIFRIMSLLNDSPFRRLLRRDQPAWDPSRTIRNSADEPFTNPTFHQTPNQPEDSDLIYPRSRRDMARLDMAPNRGADALGW